MFTNLMQRVMKQKENSLPFVIYKKPKALQINAVFQKDDELHHLKDFTETGFVFAPFDSSKHAILIQADERASATYKADYWVESTIHDFELDDFEKDVHNKLVQKGIDEILNSGLQKVVLSRKVKVPCDTRSTELFERLIATYPNAFCYLWYHPKVG